MASGSTKPTIHAIMQSVLRLRHVMAPTYVGTAGGEWLNQTDDPHEYEIGSAHIKRQANRHNKIDVESNEIKIKKIEDAVLFSKRRESRQAPAVSHNNSFLMYTSCCWRTKTVT